MLTIKHFDIVLSVYHDSPVCRIRFDKAGTIEESALYSPSELTNILELWRMDALQGSFAIGTRLAPDAGFTLCTADSGNRDSDEESKRRGGLW